MHADELAAKLERAKLFFEGCFTTDCVNGEFRALENHGEVIHKTLLWVPCSPHKIPPQLIICAPFCSLRLAQMSVAQYLCTTAEAEGAHFLVLNPSTGASLGPRSVCRSVVEKAPCSVVVGAGQAASGGGGVQSAAQSVTGAQANGSSRSLRQSTI